MVRSVLRTGSIAVGLGLLVGLGACVRSPSLRPAPDARVVSQNQSMAFAEVEGVRIWADGDAWRAYPRDLGDIVTPVWVHIENRSGRPVRVAYKHFELIGANGFHYRALSPFRISRAQTESQEPARYASFGPSLPQQRAQVRVGIRTGPIGHPRIYYHRYHVAPYYHHIYGPHVGFSYWHDPWPYDYGYYDRYYRWETALPTRDMLQRALPEGVIDPGGGIGGYVYFQLAYDAARLWLHVDLVDADTGESFGETRIPFTVER